VIELTPESLDRLADAVAERLALRAEQPAEQWPGWLSIETASRYLDCSPQRLYKLAARDQIPHVNDGRLWFEREALDQWMRTRSDPPPPTEVSGVVG
jgi:excisionase family DNA binding protein